MVDLGYLEDADTFCYTGGTGERTELIREYERKLDKARDETIHVRVMLIEYIAQVRYWKAQYLKARAKSENSREWRQELMEFILFIQWSSGRIYSTDGIVYATYADAAAAGIATGRPYYVVVRAAWKAQVRR